MRGGGGRQVIYKGENARKTKWRPRPEAEPTGLRHVSEHLMMAARGVAYKWFFLSPGQEEN